ncbi:MAG: hypothetical protein ABJC79_09940 [Acidimicrobiia bacterium]
MNVTRRCVWLHAVALMALAAVVVGGCSITTRVDVPVHAATPVGGSTPFAVSFNGRFVGFQSMNSNLVNGDTNASGDVFVRDLNLKQTVRMSVRPDGGQIAGRSTAFGMDEASDYVIFTTSVALVPGDVNGRADLYVRNRSDSPATTEFVSVDTTGTPLVGTTSDVTSASISDSGRYIAFTIQDQAHATPGVAYVRDIIGHTTRLLGGPADPRAVAISGDGLHFVVTPWTNSGPNPGPVMVDPTGSTLATRTFCVGVGVAAISADGRSVALTQGQPGSGCVAVDRPSLWDRQTDTIIPLASGPTYSLRISGASRLLDVIALVDAAVFDHQVVVVDRGRNITRTVSTGMFGQLGNGPSNLGLISGNGARVVFASSATNLNDDPAGDPFDHIFVKDALVASITGVNPVSIPRGATTVVTFNGSGLSNASAVWIDGVVVHDLNDFSDTVAQSALEVPSTLSPGRHDVWVFGGSSGTVCPGCLTVT